MIGYGASGHTVFFGKVKQLVMTARAVKKAELGMNVQMYKIRMRISHVPCGLFLGG
jgi:hypothetical protein